MFPARELPPQWTLAAYTRVSKPFASVVVLRTYQVIPVHFWCIPIFTRFCAVCSLLSHLRPLVYVPFVSYISAVKTFLASLLFTAVALSYCTFLLIFRFTDDGKRLDSLYSLTTLMVRAVGQWLPTRSFCSPQ